MDLDETTSAYHEAGHVLIAHLLGGEVLETTLETELDGHRGHTQVAWRGLASGDLARASAFVALAGPIAETLWRGGGAARGVLRRLGLGLERGGVGPLRRGRR